jgi:putative membrane protein
MLKQTLGEILPTVNAGLNCTCALLLCAGYAAIRTGRRGLHARLMVSAFAVSLLFLVCYAIRVMLTGTHPFPGTGAVRAVYLVVLASHMLLAMATPPLAVAAILLGRAGRLAQHRRVVRFAFPIWLYVSATGVLVYLMLYHLPV